MGIFDLLFGNQQKKIQDYLAMDAIILDVRTSREYKLESIKGANF